VPLPSKRLAHLAVPIGVMGIVVMMVVPLPTAVLDLLLATNITLSLLILLVSMQVRKPLDFAVFPSLLLVATLFRLALNVSATRLVLLHGYAGKVIDAFGHFVVGGSLVVGLVIFFILIVIQFVVITNGAGRVAEVGARFTLDAMPGKQMAIDADLNTGLIDDDEARRRRAEVAAEADFYGAMDGGTKFVKGDAIAAIVITLINLVGGFVVGIMQRGLSPGESVSTYSLLSVGDGLVSQIPALLMSVATGLIVTRAATDGDMGSDVARQFGNQYRALQMGGAAVLGLVLIPGLPKIPFLVTGGIVLFMGTRLKPSAEAATVAEETGPQPVSPDSPEAIADAMRIDPLELEVAYDLVDLVDTGSGGDLLERIRALRRKLALELGMVIPLVRTRDDLELPPSTYRIKINGVETARGEAPPGTVLAIGDNLGPLPGTDTREPVFGLPGKWLPAELRHQAELSGATVVDRSSVITTHLAEVVRENAGRLLSREDVRALTDMLKRTHPVVVEELTPALLTIGEIQSVLQSLLDEQVAVRDLARIFEALSQRARTSTEQEGLVEAVRQTLGPAIAAPYAADGTLRVLTLEPRLEHELFETLRPAEGGSTLALDTDRLDGLVTEVASLVEAAEQRGHTPVMACAQQIRGALRRLLRPVAPRMPVLGYAELGQNTRIETIGVVNLAHRAAA